MALIVEKDIVIIGGGVAGLWLLNRLRAENFDVLLLEKSSLGNGQSIASQGMIHGGIKYALGGSLNNASDAIADMPDHWRRCLAGQGDVDLSGTRVLSEQYYMWPRNSLRSRLNAFLGSKVLRGRVNAVPSDQYPEFFRDRISGPLYQLKDVVLDVPSLLECLSKNYRSDIKKINWDNCNLETDNQGLLTALHINHAGEEISVRAKRFVLASGEGSRELLHRLLPDREIPAQFSMQLRPLQMTVVKHQCLAPLFVHCVADQLSTTPEVTITTHPCKDGRNAWYLGGELAESGVNRTPEEQNLAARDKITGLFPWLDLTGAEWHSFFINRAEARTPDGRRPEHASVHQFGNLMLCWPSKLTLAPELGRRVVNSLRGQGVSPGHYQNPALDFLPFPGIACPPWEISA